MKRTVVFTAAELQGAVIHLLGQKPAFFGKHVATVEFEFDTNAVDVNHKLRAIVTLFDTKQGADRYVQSGTDTENQPEGQEAPADSADTASLEGTAK